MKTHKHKPTTNYFNEPLLHVMSFHLYSVDQNKNSQVMINSFSQHPLFHNFCVVTKMFNCSCCGNCCKSSRLLLIKVRVSIKETSSFFLSFFYANRTLLSHLSLLISYIKHLIIKKKYIF